MSTLNEITIEEGVPLRHRNASLLADESDYVTENEYSVDEDQSSESDFYDSHRSIAKRTTRKHRQTARRERGSRRSEFGFGKETQQKQSRHFTSSNRSKTVDLSALDDMEAFPSSNLQYGASMRRPRALELDHAGGGASTSRGDTGPREDEVPEMKRAPPKRGKLVKQASIVPIITDSSGAMKMTFWM